MADRNIRVILAAQTAQFNAAMKGAADSVKGVTERAGAMASSPSWKAASTAALGLGAALGAGLLGAVKVAADFDKAMSGVAATGEEAKGSLNELREAALKAGADTAFSASEAAAGIEALAKAGLSTKEILSGGLRGALDLAAAGEMKVADAAEVTAKTMRQFHLEGDKAAHIADVLAAGAGKAVGDVKDFGDALAMSGTVANQYGLSMEETVGTLAMFADNAMLGSDAGTSLKTMLMRLGAPTDTAKKTMDALGISAYTSSGKFKSMDEIAGMLHDKLGALSEAERNAAMNTIFGADAIRSATIVMEKGAQGVQDYTKAVNDEGFAQRMAAERLNNLSGDIEKLGGSWETLLIKMGSSANGPMRDMVQRLDGLIQSVANMDAGAQSAILGIAGLASGSLLMVGGVMKAATAIAEFKGALETLKLGSLTSSLKAAGVAALAFALAWGAIEWSKAHEMKPAISGIDEVTKQLLKVDQGAVDAKAGLDAFFVESNGANMRTYNAEIRTMAGGFAAINNAAKGGMAGFQAWNESIDKNVFGWTHGIEKVKQQFAEMDVVLSKMDSKSRGNLFRQIQEEARKAGTSTEDLIKLFPQLKAQIDKQENELRSKGALKDVTLSAQDYADWMGGKVPDAVRKAAQATKDASPEVQALGSAMDGVYKSADQMAEEMEDARKATLALAQAWIGSKNAEIGYIQAVDAVTESIEKNGRTVDAHTKAGQANLQTLYGLASAALAVQDSQDYLNATTAVQHQMMAQQYDDFMRSAERMGMNREEAQKLAEQFHLVPQRVQTDFLTPGLFEAKVGTEAFMVELDKLPEEKQTKIRAALDAGNLAEAQRLLDEAAKERVMYIRIVKIEDYQYGNGGTQSGAGPKATADVDGFRAFGGPIPGRSPHKRADNVLIAATAGEYMMQVDAVRKYGLAFMHAINSGTYDPRSVRGYATGGPIQYTAGSSMPPMSVNVAVPDRGNSYSASLVVNEAEKPELTMREFSREWSRLTGARR